MDKAEKIFTKLAEDYAREGLLAGGLVTGLPTAALVLAKQETLREVGTAAALAKSVKEKPPTTQVALSKLMRKATKAGTRGYLIGAPLTVLGMGFMGAGIGGTIGTYTKKKPVPRRKS